MSKNNYYGLSYSGFKIPTFDAVIAETQASISDSLGAIDFAVPSVFGTLMTVFAERELIIWEAAQDIYYSNFVDYATGASLDYAVAMNNIARQRPTASKVKCQLSASNYTLIDAGSQALLKNSSILFTVPTAVTISNDRCYSISLVINDDSLAIYTIVINGTYITYTTDAEDTEATILTGLETALNEAGLYVAADVLNNTLIITTTDLSKVFTCYIGDGLDIIEVTNNAIFICNETGNIAAPSRSITQIQTPIQGWNAIDNVSSGTAGRDLESDVELRARFKNSQSINGAATEPAMTARLLQVSAVTSARVISDRENRTINALVLGGEDIDVANCIQLTRPAGMTMLGNTEIAVTDINGNAQLIKFTRPVNVYIHVEINLTTSDAYAGEDATTVIRNKVINYINSLGVNTIVAYQALFAPIYSVQGVVGATVTIGKTIVENIAPALTATNIVIGDGQMPITNADKITINIE